MLALIASNSSLSHAESTMKNDILARWTTFIVVSSTLPHDQLVSLAREASAANAVMVLNGFTNINNSIPDEQRFISEINAECCTEKRPSRWVINPKIIQRYRIAAAPSFVIARGESTRNEDFSVISGDIDLANALKSFAQKSGSLGVRQHARAVYQHTYATY